MKYDHTGEKLFQDANAWFALSEIFANIPHDPSLKSTCLIVDALDECIVDLPRLLNFVVQQSATYTRVKWIVSSRNWPDINERLKTAGQRETLCLELNAESVSNAVGIHLQHKVFHLTQLKDYLSLNANDTFLWVALVCPNLEKISSWNTLAKLGRFPPGLDSLCKRMMGHICSLEDADDVDPCKRILTIGMTACRPITLKELTSFIEMPRVVSDNLETLEKIVGLCGSFLTLQGRTISFVHQSAKDYLVEHASAEIFPNGRIEEQQRIVSRSIEAMDKALQRDVYGLWHPGCSIDKVEHPDPDPLAPILYACMYWVDHLCEIKSSHDKVGLCDNGMIDVFLRKNFLHWLEALSLIKGILDDVLAIAKLTGLLMKISPESQLFRLVQDMHRFILSSRKAIENTPLQAYSSALQFSPIHSLTRELFQDEKPKWITTKPAMEVDWGACIQTIEGHNSLVNSVAFSRDDTQVVSGSSGKTIKIWDAGSGACLETLEGHSDWVWSVAFSRAGTKVVLWSSDKTIKIWDAGSGDCLKTFNVGQTDSLYCSVRY